jgi:hypothetical protein
MGRGLNPTFPTYSLQGGVIFCPLGYLTNKQGFILVCTNIVGTKPKQGGLFKLTTIFSRI